MLITILHLLTLIYAIEPICDAEDTDDLCLIQTGNVNVVKTKQLHVPEEYDDHLYFDTHGLDEILDRLERKEHDENDLVFLQKTQQKLKDEAQSIYNHATQKNLDEVKSVINQTSSNQKHNESSDQGAIHINSRQHHFQDAIHINARQYELRQNQTGLHDLLHDSRGKLVQYFMYEFNVLKHKAEVLIERINTFPPTVRYICFGALACCIIIALTILFFFLKFIFRPKKRMVRINEISLGDLGHLHSLSAFSLPVKPEDTPEDSLEDIRKSKHLVDKVSHGDAYLANLYLVVDDGEIKREIATRAKADGRIAVFLRPIEITTCNSYFAPPITFELHLKVAGDDRHYLIYKYRLQNNTVYRVSQRDTGLRKFFLEKCHTHGLHGQKSPGKPWIAMRFVPSDTPIYDMTNLTAKQQKELTQRNDFLCSFVGKIKSSFGPVHQDEGNPDKHTHGLIEATNCNERSAMLRQSVGAHQPRRPREIIHPEREKVKKKSSWNKWSSSPDGKVDPPSDSSSSKEEKRRPHIREDKIVVGGQATTKFWELSTRAAKSPRHSIQEESIANIPMGDVSTMGERREREKLEPNWKKKKPNEYEPGQSIQWNIVKSMIPGPSQENPYDTPIEDDDY